MESTDKSPSDGVGSSLLERPVFVVGPGRSGTTLLRTLLSAHSRMAVAPETHFLEWVDAKYDPRKAPRDFETFWSWYTSWTRFRDLGVSPERCRELIEQQEDRTFQSIFRASLTAFGERTGKARVGEKTPGHVHYLSLLFEWFPEAQILITQRDPRAVIASALKTPFSQGRMKPPSLRQGIFTANRVHETVHWIDDWRAIYEKVVPAWVEDPRVFLVSYERLVTDTEATMHAVCDFLEEPFEPEMIGSHTRAQVPTPSGEMRVPEHEKWRREHLAKTTQPVSADSMGKWAKELSRREVAMIEGACWKGMQALGYLPTTSPVTQGAGRVLTDAARVAARAENEARSAYREVRGQLRERAQ
jgi:hypothetical protein